VCGHHFITGVAGFIGSQLADELLHDGLAVSGADDFSLGRRDNLSKALGWKSFHLFKADVGDVGPDVRDYSARAGRHDLALSGEQRHCCRRGQSHD
jgi:nucleoside-diphosphate-sugar epimerase